MESIRKYITLFLSYAPCFEYLGSAECKYGAVCSSFLRILTHLTSFRSRFEKDRSDLYFLDVYVFLLIRPEIQRSINDILLSPLPLQCPWVVLLHPYSSRPSHKGYAPCVYTSRKFFLFGQSSTISLTSKV